MTPADIAEGRRLVEEATSEGDPPCSCGNFATFGSHHASCALVCSKQDRFLAESDLRVYLRNHAAKLLDAAEQLADTDTWAKRQYDRAEKAERERDDAKIIVATLVYWHDQGGRVDATWWDAARALGES